MIEIQFTPEDIEALNYERYHYPHPRVQMKMEALWLKSQGMAHKEIARLTGICENTLRSYLRDFLHGGIEKLKEVNFYQRTSELTNHTTTIESYFKEHPPATIKEAKAKIFELTGIERSENRVRIFLKSIGLKRYKVGMVPGKADPDQQQEFKKKSYSHVWTKPEMVKEPSFLLMPLISF